MAAGIFAAPTPRPMPAVSLATLLQAGYVAVGLRAETKADVLDALAGRLAEAPEVTDVVRLRADLAAREARMSTGVGEGLALPHARTPAVSGTVAALATLAVPVEWGSLDGAPVDLVLMLAGPEGERAAHVHLLAHVSRVISTPGVRARLAGAASADDLREVIAAAEAHGPAGG